MDQSWLKSIERASTNDDERWKEDLYPIVGDMVRTRESYVQVKPLEVGVVVEVGEDRKAPRFKVLFEGGDVKQCFFYELEKV